MNYFVFEFRILDLSSCASSSHIHLYGLRWKAHSSNADEPAKYRMRPVIESGPGGTRGSSGRSFDFREYPTSKGVLASGQSGPEVSFDLFLSSPLEAVGIRAD